MLEHLAKILVAYGPWGIFLLNVIDSLGIPLPGASDVLLIGVAAASAKAPEVAYFAAFMAVLGSATGNMGLFLAARQGRRWLAARRQSEGNGGRFRGWFHRYGLLSVFLPAAVPFIPLPLKVFVISAGAMHTPVGRFLGVIVLARLIRYFGEAYLGLKLGSGAGEFLRRNVWLLAGVVLVMVAAAIWVIRRRGRLPLGDPSLRNDTMK